MKAPSSGKKDSHHEPREEGHEEHAIEQIRELHRRTSTSLVETSARKSWSWLTTSSPVPPPRADEHDLREGRHGARVHVVGGLVEYGEVGPAPEARPDVQQLVLPPAQAIETLREQRNELRWDATGVGTRYVEKILSRERHLSETREASGSGSPLGCQGASGSSPRRRGCDPMMAPRMVDLPAPLGPASPTTSPGRDGEGHGAHHGRRVTCDHAVDLQEAVGHCRPLATAATQRSMWSR